MSVRIINAGVQSSLQDMGRTGFQWQGVPVSGAMDTFSYRLANMLIGNDVNAVVIECTGAGLNFVPETELLLTLCGGGSVLSINEQELPSYRPVVVKAFSVIQLKPITIGFRSYLAVKNGFEGQADLGSVSTYVSASLGGSNGNFLTDGTILEINKSVHRLMKTPGKLFDEQQSYYVEGWGITGKLFDYVFSNQVRVIKGPEWNNFKEPGKLFSGTFQISQQSDRMGYRLKGPTIVPVSNEELVSTAVSAGLIQCTPDGNLLLLMADAQTTGGYPRIARVAAIDIAKCAQLKPGSEINFVPVSAEEAEELYLKRELELARLKHMIDLQYY